MLLLTPKLCDFTSLLLDVQIFINPFGTSPIAVHKIPFLYEPYSAPIAVEAQSLQTNTVRVLVDQMVKSDSKQLWRYVIMFIHAAGHQPENTVHACT